VSLYKAETRRLVKRRFTKLFVIGMLLILGAIATGVFLTNQKVGPAEVAAAQEEARQEFQRSLAQAEQEKVACEAAKGTATRCTRRPRTSSKRSGICRPRSTSWATSRRC
jgi:ABC-2 type transport system permease protein